MREKEWTPNRKATYRGLLKGIYRGLAISLSSLAAGWICAFIFASSDTVVVSVIQGMTGIAVLGGMIGMPYFSAKSYREGVCPVCRNPIGGMVYDRALRCKKCRSRIHIQGDRFFVAQDVDGLETKR